MTEVIDQSFDSFFFIIIEQTFIDILRATCRKKDIGLNRYDERTNGRGKRHETVITPQGNVYTKIEKCVK